MPMSAIELYMERLPKFKAELRMILGEAANVPYMDEEVYRDWLWSIENALHGNEKKNKVSSPAMLKMMGIGVEIVSREK